MFSSHNLSLHVSVRARLDLVAALIGEIQASIDRQRDEQIARGIKGKPGRPKSPETVLAELVGVSSVTVYRWTGAAFPHCGPSNQELAKILLLAPDYAPEAAARIVMRDIRSYIKAAEPFLLECGIQYKVGEYTEKLKP